MQINRGKNHDCAHIYIYFGVCVGYIIFMCLSLSIYIYRERGRERDINTHDKLENDIQ